MAGGIKIKRKGRTNPSATADAAEIKAAAAKREARLARLASQNAEDDMDLTVPQVCVGTATDARSDARTSQNKVSSDLGQCKNSDLDCEPESQAASAPGRLQSADRTSDDWMQLVTLFSKRELRRMLRLRFLTREEFLQKSMAIQPVIASSLDFAEMSATEIATMMTVMQTQLTLLSEKNTPSVASGATVANGDSPATAPSQQVDSAVPDEAEKLPADENDVDISMMDDCAEFADTPHEYTESLPASEAEEQDDEIQIQTESEKLAEQVKEHGHCNPEWPSFQVKGPEQLFAAWKLMHKREIEETYDSNSTGRACYTNERLPVSLLTRWGDVAQSYIGWTSTRKTFDANDVITAEDLALFFEQPKVPAASVAVLLQYDGGDLSEPLQWPRITSRTILDVFKRIKGADTEEIQGDLLAWLIDTQPDYQRWVDAQWSRFDFRRNIERLPDVPADQRGFIHLEADKWDRGPTFQSKGARRAAVRTGEYVRGALAHEKLPEKRTFSDVAGASAAKPPDVQRSGKPGPTGSLGPHVERLVDLYQGNVTLIDSKLMRQAVMADEQLAQLGGNVSGEQSELPLRNDTELPPKRAVRFRFADSDNDNANPQVDSNNVRNVVPPTNTQNATPVVSEAERLLVELRRIEQIVRTLNANNVNTANTANNDGNVNTPANNSVPHSGVSTPPVSTADRSRRRHRRNRSPSTSDSGSSRSRSRSNRTTSRRTASQEKRYNESASIVDQTCPLPHNDTEEAASDYMHDNLPLSNTSKFKTFMLNCKPYVENGPVTWEKWTFSIRTECKRLNFSYDQTWRLATTLLPENLQSIIYKEVMRSDFMGLCYVSWKRLAGKAAVRMEPVAHAIKELQAMKFATNETVVEFVHRFKLVAARAMAPSSGMAQSLRPSQVFTYLNIVFSTRDSTNPKWLVSPWNTRYGEVHNETKQACLALSVTGAALSEKQKDDIVDRAVETMCDWAVTTATTREDTQSEMHALTAVSTDAPARSRQATPRYSGAALINVATTSSRGRGRGFHNGAGRAGGAGRGTYVNTVTETPPNAGRTSEDGSRSYRVRIPYGSAKQALPAFDNVWTTLPQAPRQNGQMTSQGQACAEFGFCTFEEANNGFKTKTCAACKMPYASCTSIYSCTAIPTEHKEKIQLRSQYLNIQRSNRLFEKKQATAVQ